MACFDWPLFEINMSPTMLCIHTYIGKIHRKNIIESNSTE